MRKVYSLIAAVALAASAAITTTSCEEEKYHIRGHIADAADSLLYLENISLEGPVAVDSVRLGADGAFEFSGVRNDAPEFYRLRIARSIVNVSIDSTETVAVEASYPSMVTGYKVTGSDNCERIRRLALKQIELHRTVEGMAALADDVYSDSLARLIEAFKDDVRTNYIYADPTAASSYFALFQTLGSYLIFDPRGAADDVRAFAAVATAWDTYHPGSPRTANLHNIAIEGMKTTRIVEGKRQQTLDPSKVSEAGLIDMALPDKDGTLRTLSGLKGKVVMLDFHVFGTKESPQRIIMMRELYTKYHDRGFEIYQIGLDPNEHFWKQQTANLPWICVYDEEGLASSRLALYNVRMVPEYFLIDRENTLVSRSVQVEDIQKAIENLLK